MRLERTRMRVILNIVFDRMHRSHHFSFKNWFLNVFILQLHVFRQGLYYQWRTLSHFVNLIVRVMAFLTSFLI